MEAFIVLKFELTGELRLLCYAVRDFEVRKLKPLVSELDSPHAYMEDFGVEKTLRDAKMTEIYEGTNEMIRLTIADKIIRRRLIA